MSARDYSSGARAAVGAVGRLHRYPVKSMIGEDLDAALVTAHGIFGDHAYALCDTETGKIVSAKNPRRWPDFFRYGAAFTSAPTIGAAIPPVRVTMPGGAKIETDNPDFDTVLSQRLGRGVKLLAAPPRAAQLEEYWLDVEELQKRDVVTDENLPEGSFFDAAPLHLLTTATLARFGELSPDSRFEEQRFRPSILIDVGKAKGFMEDRWIGQQLAIGAEVCVQITRPCFRCVMTTLAQGDLPNDPEILKTAVKYNEKHVGVYASVIQGGTVRLGDTITIH